MNVMIQTCPSGRAPLISSLHLQAAWSLSITSSGRLQSGGSMKCTGAFKTGINAGMQG